MSTAALQAFRDQCGNNPSSSSAAADSEQLLGLKEEVAAKYGISTDIITEEFSRYVPWHDWTRELGGGGELKISSSPRGVPSFRHCFSELSPVCAIVGGVLGQEIIKVSSSPFSGMFTCQTGTFWTPS